MSRSQTDSRKPSPIRPDARPTRARLLGAALLAALAVGLLVYRIATLPKPSPESEHLHLSDEVVLTPPPPLPGDDRLKLRQRLDHLRQMRQDAQAHPDDIVLRSRVAEEALHVGDLFAAREEGLALLRAHPDAPPGVYVTLGDAQAQLGLFAESRRTYQALLARAPTSADSYIGLSRAQAQLGQKAQARATWQQAARAIPANLLPERLHLAYEYEKRGDLERALNEAEAVLRVAPDDPVALLMAGHLQFKLVHLSEAQTRLEKLVAAHPDDRAGRRTLAAVLDNPMLPGRNRGRAEQLLLETLQAAPDDLPSYSQLGKMYQEQGRYRQAAYIYTRLLENSPDLAAARLQLSRAYARLGDTRQSAEQDQIAQRLLTRDNAEAQLSKKIDRHPTDPQARLELARHYIRSGQFTNALAQLQAAYALAPTAPEPRRELTAFYAQVGLPPPTLPAAQELQK